MREIPKALEAAIKKMPQTEIPETDLSPLVSKFDDMLAKLSEIDTGVRMKPQSPSTLKVTNPDGSPIGSSLTPGTDFDYIDCQQTSATVETYVYKQGGVSGTTVQTITVTYTAADKENLDKVEYA